MPELLDEMFARFCRSRDLRALASVFDQTAPELLRIARHLCGNHADAEDVVQQTFLAAIESRNQYDPSQAVLPWLVGIAANHVRMLHRRNARPLDRVLREERVLPDPSTSAEHHELVDEVTRLLSQFEEPYGPVLTLYLRHGLKAEEIASFLRRPATSVRSQIARGLELLRRALPAGFAVGVTVLATPARGIAALREAVLTHAEAAMGAATGATAATASASAATAGAFAGARILGGVVVMKQLVAALAVIVMIGIAWWTWTWPWSPESRRSEVAAADPAPGVQGTVALQNALTSDLTTQRSAVVIPSKPTSAATGEVLVRVQHASDHSPAGFVTVKVIPPQSRGPLTERLARTDANGEVQLRDLLPGELEVRADRGGTSKATVRVGERVELLLEIPAGVDLLGFVVDREQQPVAGARIVLLASKIYDVGNGLEGARTGRAGEFQLRSVRAGTWLAAYAPHYAPSALIEVKSSSEPLQIVLERNETMIAGIVLDPDAKPLAGAHILLGASMGMSIELPGMVRRPSFNLRSDADGRFEAWGIYARTPLWVGAPGAAPWHRDLTIEPDKPNFVEVRLQREAVLSGSVRDAAGSPLSGLRITVVASSIGAAPGAVQVPTWANPTHRSGSGGAFRISELPPGETRVVVAGEDKGRAEHSFVAVAGTESQWDAVLGSGLSIRGTITDETGAPLAGLEVLATPSRDGGSAQSDRSGAFVIHSCAPEAHTLYVKDGRSALLSPLVVRKGVRPQDGEIQLRVPQALLSRSAILGAVVDGEGQPVLDATVTPRRIDTLPAVRVFDVDRSTGKFRLAPITSGVYDVVILSRSLGELRVRGIELGDRHELDLGSVAFAKPGTLLLEVNGPDGQPLAGGRIDLTPDERGYGENLFIQKGRAASKPRQPGTGSLWFGAQAPFPPWHCEPFAVRAGEQTKVTITLPGGVERKLRIVEGTIPLATVGMVDFEFRVASGKVLARYHYNFTDGSPFERACMLVPGSYEVVASQKQGARAVTQFVVKDLTPTNDIIEIRLP